MGATTIPATPGAGSGCLSHGHLRPAGTRQRGDLLRLSAAWAHDYLYQHLDAVDGDPCWPHIGWPSAAPRPTPAHRRDSHSGACREIKRLEQRFGTGLPTKLELPIRPGQHRRPVGGHDRQAAHAGQAGHA
ncbi:MAG: hypothetical protein V9H69_10535 [Anaerolineae bacterium]